MKKSNKLRRKGINQMKLRRIMAIIIAVSLILTLFAGCSNNTASTDGTTSSSSSSKSDSKNNNTTTIKNVFKAEYIPVDSSLSDVYNIVYYDGKFYFSGYILDPTDGAYKYSLMEIGLDGTGLKKLPIDISSDNMNINDFIVNEDGNLVFCATEYSYTEESHEENIYLKIIDREGNVLKDIDANTLKPDDTEAYFYINNIASDKEGNIYLNTGNSLIVLDSNGTKLFDIESTNYIGNLYKIKDGSVIISSYADNGMKFFRIDTAAKGIGEELSAENLNYNYSIMDGSEKYDLYMSNSTSVYGFNFADGNIVELINWIDSDIDTDTINMTIPLPDGRFTCYSYDWETSQAELIMLTEVSAEEIPERTIITLSTPYLDYEIRKAVISFNKTNEKYRVKINDYSSYATYEDYNAGTTRFNTDLISGNIPDIIVTDSSGNLDNYIAKGILLDLYTLLEADEDYSKEDFVQSLLKACETDGKMYFFTPAFGISTYVAKTSLVGEELGWTMDDLNALMKKMPDAKIFSESTKSGILSESIRTSIEQFVDMETGKCSFNTQGFIDLLEFCNTFPDEINYDEMYGEDFDWEEYYTYSETMYRDDKVLLMNTYVSDFDLIRNIEKAQFGEPVTFVGFPASNEKGSVFSPSQKFAITAKSKNIEGAWEFIKYFMTDEYQYNEYLFPARIDILNKKAEEAMIPDTYENDEGEIVEMENIYYLSTGEINVGYPDQADIDKTMELINSVTSFINLDEKLISIIQEEAGAYFSGQKTASAVADLIQNKASIYIAESR